MENKTNKNLRQEIREKISGYLTAAFGLIVGLAWNDAVKALIDSIYPAGDGGLLAKFVYALGLTAILVIVTIYLIGFLNKNK